MSCTIKCCFSTYGVDSEWMFWFCKGMDFEETLSRSPWLPSPVSRVQNNLSLYSCQFCFVVQKRRRLLGLLNRLNVTTSHISLCWLSLYLRYSKETTIAVPQVQEMTAFHLFGKCTISRVKYTGNTATQSTCLLLNQSCWWSWKGQYRVFKLNVFQTKCLMDRLD